ncbi:MAG: enoyl-CoA hydratase-related protein [Thermomicrobiales bacterium]
MTYETIVVEIAGRVGIIRLNRPQAQNALNATLKGEVGDALTMLEKDDAIGCIVITGSEGVFAAGADIKELLHQKGPTWDRIAASDKPIVAAVAGYALGGGCEVAMQADIIIAADTAKFGQPEVKIAVIPGCGGTQRLAHAIGKAKAMDLIFTGRMMDAHEAERLGLVSRVVPAADLMQEALKVAHAIAAMSLPSIVAAKMAINAAFEKPLSEGLRFEVELCDALFSTEDQKEGVRAFLEKRTPQWRNK